MSTKKERMYMKIYKHGEYLIEFFGLPEETDAVELCKKLFSLEKKAEKIATRWCNGEATAEEYQVEEKKIINRLEKIGISGCFVNADPRGYALKIDSEEWEGYSDFGGYGILAPDFSEK